MMVGIKDVSGKVLFSGDYPSLKECVEAAVRKSVCLAGADLRGTNL